MTKLWIFEYSRNLFLNFFEVQNWDCQTGKTQLLEKKYYIIYQKFIISSHIKQLFFWHANHISLIFCRNKPKSCFGEVFSLLNSWCLLRFIKVLTTSFALAVITEWKLLVVLFISCKNCVVCLLKVSQSQKEFLAASHAPKNQQFFSHFLP